MKIADGNYTAVMEADSATYPVRQICVHGHEVPLVRIDTRPYYQDWCPLCGADACDACDECGTPVPFDDCGGRALPAYCRGCGYPFIWTNELLAKAEDCIANMDRLTPAERAQLLKRVMDVIREEPVADVAARIARTLLDKAGHDATHALWIIVFGLVPSRMWWAVCS